MEATIVELQAGLDFVNSAQSRNYSLYLFAFVTTKASSKEDGNYALPLEYSASDAGSTLYSHLLSGNVCLHIAVVAVVSCSGK